MGYQRLLEEYGHTQEKLAQTLGKSRSHVANMVRLLALPDVVLAFLERGDLSTGHARALITAKDPESLAKQVVSSGFNVRQTEKLAQELHGHSKKTKSSSKKSVKDVDTIALEENISTALGLRVSIDSKNGRAGKVLIYFKSLDQLDDLLKKLIA